MRRTTFLLAAAIATTAAMSSNTASAGRAEAATPSTVPTITALETATLGQAVSTGILRLSIFGTTEPNMAIKMTGGVLLGKRWFLIGQRSLKLPDTNGKRVHRVVRVGLSKHGIELLKGRKSAKLRFLVWCADEPTKANKLVVTLHR